MKDLPLSLFWAFWRVGKSLTYVASMRAWSSNPPPATKFPSASYARDFSDRDRLNAPTILPRPSSQVILPTQYCRVDVHVLRAACILRMQMLPGASPPRGSLL